MTTIANTINNLSFTGNNYTESNIILPGATVNSLSEIGLDGMTAISASCVEGHLHTAQLLYQHGAQLNLGGYKPLILASFTGQTEVVQWLLNEGKKSLIKSSQIYIHAPDALLTKRSHKNGHVTVN